MLFGVFAEKCILLKCFSLYVIYQRKVNSGFLSFLLEGLWLGLLISVFIETCIFLVLTYKLDWKKITRKVILEPVSSKRRTED